MLDRTNFIEDRPDTVWPTLFSTRRQRLIATDIAFDVICVAAVATSAAIGALIFKDNVTSTVLSATVGAAAIAAILGVISFIFWMRNIRMDSELAAKKAEAYTCGASAHNVEELAENEMIEKLRPKSAYLKHMLLICFLGPAVGAYLLNNGSNLAAAEVVKASSTGLACLIPGIMVLMALIAALASLGVAIAYLIEPVNFNK